MRRPEKQVSVCAREVMMGGYSGGWFVRYISGWVSGWSSMPRVHCCTAVNRGTEGFRRVRCARRA